MTNGQFDIPGGWTEQTIDLGGRTLDLLLPADPDRVLLHFEADPAAPAALGEDPYWAKLWPAAVTLAQKVYREPWPASLRVLELGCGLGLAGLAAAACGLSVTLSDYNPLAVALALENARRNGLAERVTGLTLDWRRPPRAEFDLLLAADVAYDRTLHQPLLDSLAALAAPGAVAWIGDSGRSATEDFLLAALERWDVTVLDQADRPVRDVHLGAYRTFVCPVTAAATHLG